MNTEKTTYHHLQLVHYSTIPNWSVQYLRSNCLLCSDYPIRMLGNYIQEESKKYGLNSPTTKYGILGVNNQTGIFDAYTEEGGNIKQKYKRMKEGWIAYNPYRVNVGSVGVKHQQHKNEYISPAYVVFSCKEELLPDFLYLMMKTPTFIQMIRRNTTGSVRQSLSFKNLKNIKIPLPSLENQYHILERFYQLTNKSNEYEQACKNLDKDIRSKINSLLGIKNDQGTSFSYSLRFIHFYETLTRWDSYAVKKTFQCRWPTITLGNLLTRISTGTTPPTSHAEYFDGDICFYTPADFMGEIYLGDSERHISQKAIDEGMSKIYHKGDILFVGIGSTIGKVGIIAKDIVSANQQITGFRVDYNRVSPEYVYCFLNYHREISTAEQARTTLPIVNQMKIARIPIPVPPIEIQEEITAYMKEKRAIMEKLHSEAQQLKKQALQEFEQTLFENHAIEK